MPARAYLNGRVVPAEEAVVSVFDRGFLYGDSVFEVLRTYGGKPFALAAHWERLERSAVLLGIDMRWSLADGTDALREVLAAAGNDDSYVRIIVTRGGGEIGLDPALATTPERIVIVNPLVRPPEELYARGCKVQIVAIRRDPGVLDPRAKSGNYLSSIQAIREAREAHAYEAILLNSSGAICEGSSSNLFIARKGEIITPPIDAGILEGITRSTVIAICGRRGIRVREREVRPDDLFAADEAFITSSIREVMPVVACGDNTIATGVPGQLTRAVAAAYSRFAAESASF